jgi:methionyl-tRNA synthetase
MPETADSEWRWEDFQRTTNQLADVIGNLTTRVLRFVDKHFDGRVPALAPAHEAELDASLLERSGAIADPGDEVLAFRFRRAAERLIANATGAASAPGRSRTWPRSSALTCSSSATAARARS